MPSHTIRFYRGSQVLVVHMADGHEVERIIGSFVAFDQESLNDMVVHMTKLYCNPYMKAEEALQDRLESCSTDDAIDMALNQFTLDTSDIDKAYEAFDPVESVDDMVLREASARLRGNGHEAASKYLRKCARPHLTMRSVYLRLGSDVGDTITVEGQ